MARRTFAGFTPLQLLGLGAGSWLLFTEGGNAAVTSMVPQAAEFLAILPKLPGSGPADAAANGDQAAGNGNGGSNGNGVAQPASTVWLAFKSGTKLGSPDYVFVQSVASPGVWRRVTGPQEYAEYGIAANESTIRYVFADEGGLWFRALGPVTGPALETYLREDTRSGLLNNPPTNASAAAQTALCELARRGLVVAANVHGAALLALYQCL